MANKNLKLTLATLFGGVAALSAGSALVLTSCNNGEDNGLTTLAQVEKYLLDNKTKLNNEEALVQQVNKSLASDSDFNTFLNTHLTPQNLLNALIQVTKEANLSQFESNSSFKLVPKINGNNFSLTVEASGIHEGDFRKVYESCDFTLVPANVTGGALTPAKLSGTVSYKLDEDDLVEIVYGADNGLELTSAYRYGGEVGFYNRIVFGVETGNPTTGIGFDLSGKIDVQGTVYTSTLDTENVFLFLNLLK
jgi:hypothetical protein